MMEHARIWFDHTVCDLNTDVFRRYASDAFLLSGGRIDVDLTALRSGRIELWLNPAMNDRATEIKVIDECVDMLRKTCAQSGVFDPDLYPNNDSIRKNASER